MSEVVLQPSVPLPPPAFLVMDTESVPDGELLARTKYPDEKLSPAEAIARAQAQAREESPTGSDFIEVVYQVPISICVARVARDFSLEAVTCLDAPQFRTREMVQLFWRGVNKYKKSKLVTFNGRGFDLPLLELAAFRYGCTSTDYFLHGRNRFTSHIDLLDWFANFGALRTKGLKLDVFSKLIGKPGKMGVAGDQVYRMHLEGKTQEINDYCMCDTLDTYFVFLRTRVMTGDLTLLQEQELTLRAKEWLRNKASELPVLGHYLDNWGTEPST